MTTSKRVPGTGFYASSRDVGHDWFVSTSSKAWPAAMVQLKRDVQDRAVRLSAWESTQTGRGSDPGYWERYDREKYRVPIDWPMPEGHVCFSKRS